MFQKATKSKARLRMALMGPSGSGKTYTALSIAMGLGSRIAVLDTERGSASKYADEFDFDTAELADHHPKRFIGVIEAAAKAEYDVLIIDSLSHAWIGKGGALELADQAGKRARGNTFAGWNEVTPLQRELVDAILTAPLHMIVTMRSKTEYVLEAGRNGKVQPRKVGLAPVQRADIEFEFDVIGELDHEHTLAISKTRCRAIDGLVINCPGRELGEQLAGWLSDGAAVATVQNTTAAVMVDSVSTAAPHSSAVVDRACRLSEIDWTPEDLAAYLGTWIAETGDRRKVVEALVREGTIRTRYDSSALAARMLAVAGAKRLGELSAEQLAGTWCTVVCPVPLTSVMVPSSELGKEYRVTFNDKGKATHCECEGYRHRGTCRHLAEADALRTAQDDLESLPGVGKALAVKLRDAGLKTVSAVEEAISYKPEALAELLGDEVYDALCSHFGYATKKSKGAYEAAVDALIVAAQATGASESGVRERVLDDVVEAVCKAHRCKREVARTMLENAAQESLGRLDPVSLAAAWEEVMPAKKAA